MADDVVLQSSTLATPAAGERIAAEEVSTLNGGAVTAQKVQRVAPSLVTANGTAVDVTSSNPMPVSDAGSTLSVDDGGASLTVDGTVAATQSGTWNVTNVSGTVSLPTGAATLAEQQTQTAALSTIDDAVVADDAAFTPATTKVMMAGFEYDDTTPDSVNEGDAGAARMSANRNLYAQLRDAAGNERGANVTAANALVVDGSAVTQPVSGTVTVNALPAGDNNIGNVDIVTVPAPLSTTGGGTEASALRVTVASDSTGVLSVDDNGSSLTVDAPVGTPVFVRLSDGASAISTLPVSLASVPSHAVTNAGTFAVQVDGSALTSLQLIDDVVLAEDAVHASGDKGVMALAVRKDSGATIAGTDGDYSPLQVDASGNLRVNIAAGAAAGGTSATDEAAYTPASSAGTPIMGAADETTPDAAAEGTLAIIRSTLSRALHVNLRDAAGNEVAVGGGTQYTEDAAAAANPVGTALNLIRADTLAGVTSADGDNVAARGTDKGELYVKHVDAIPVTDNGGTLTVDGTVAATQSGTWNVGTVTTVTTVSAVTAISNALPAGTNNIGDVDVLSVVPGTGATSLGKAIDTAAGATDTGVAALVVRDDALTTLTPADGDFVPMRTNSTGALWVDASGQTLTVASHAVTNAGTFAVQATVAAAAANIAKAEDVASADADVGVPAMAVRKATPANTSGTDGDYEMLQMSAGRLWTSATVDAALPAGTNNIGDVDVLTVPAPLSTSGGGTEATALRVTVASDSTGVISVDDNGSSLTVDGTVAATQSGTWTVQPGNTANTTAWLVNTEPKTSGGLSISRTISAATTNATSAKGSAGQVYTIIAHNTNAAVRYLKLYNKASAPTVGTDTPVLTLPIPGNTAGAGFVLNTGGMGIAFGTGIAYALTTGVADSDTAAVAANEIVVQVLYK